MRQRGVHIKYSPTESMVVSWGTSLYRRLGNIVLFAATYEHLNVCTLLFGV